MYGTAITRQSPNPSDACFLGQIASVTVDAKDQAIVTLQPCPGDTQRGYLVVTKEQAIDAATNGLSSVSWEQHIELDQANQRLGRR